MNGGGRVLVVAASDSGGGAGIQADIKTIMALGGYGTTAVTAVTAQNTQQIYGIHPVPADFVVEQMRAVLHDIGADVIKIGMLGNAATAEAVADVLESPLACNIPVVLDPVLVSSSGTWLLDSAGFDTLKRRLALRALLLTPNVPEAEAMTGLQIRDFRGVESAAEMLLTLGVPNVLLKGGHLGGDELVDLLLADDFSRYEFRHKRSPAQHTHGTGCTLASAVATGLAKGLPLPTAVEEACAYVQAAIGAAPGLGRGAGPLGHAVRLESVQ